jgi:uncharacterized membrane-anchored protein YhcB (DUF1043 family)
MEFLGSVWQIGLLALAAGILIGILAYRIYSASSSKANQVRAELDQTREEMASYRAEVQGHFDKTSELFNELTQNYARVYRHLAEGAHALGDGKTLNNLLEQQPGKVVIAVDDEPGEAAARKVDAPVAASDASPDKALADEAVIAAARAEAIDFVVGEAPADDREKPTARGNTKSSDPDIGDLERADWEPVSAAAEIEPAAAAESGDETRGSAVQTGNSGQKKANKETAPA